MSTTNHGSPVPPASAPAATPEPTFDHWYAKPCTRCGGKRDYRVDGQMQVVCFRCANPPAAPTGEEAETDDAARLAMTVDAAEQMLAWMKREGESLTMAVRKCGFTGADVRRLLDALTTQATALAALRARVDHVTELHDLDDWHEDDGVVLWWRLPVDEPPYCGTPLDTDWPGYHTCWTVIPEPRAALAPRQPEENAR